VHCGQRSDRYQAGGSRERAGTPRLSFATDFVAAPAPAGVAVQVIPRIQRVSGG
jgi:hypothetical protein